MGGSQSTRKVTVDNENAIQVSQEALDRISAQLSSKQAEQPQPQPQTTYSIPPPPPFDSRKQQELAAEEAYWARRIETLKHAHEKISNGMMNEYQKTLDEANELFNLTQQDKVVNKVPPCQEEKSKVLDCYSTNPNKSLVCAVVVNQFNDCVCKSRIAAVTSS